MSGLTIPPRPDDESIDASGDRPLAQCRWNLGSWTNFGLVLMLGLAASIATMPRAWGVRIRGAALVAIALFAFAAIWRWRTPARPRVTRDLVLLGTVGALAAVCALATAPAGDPGPLGLTVASVFTGLAILVAIAGVEATGVRVCRPRLVGRWPYVVSVVIAAIAMSVTMSLWDGMQALDEMLYVFQAHTLTEPGLGRQMEEDIGKFFVLAQSYLRDGRLYGQYPVGWPAALALATSLGISQWAGALLGSAAVALTGDIGRRLGSAHTGVLASLLLATNLSFVSIGGSFFAHALTSASVLAAMWALVRADGTGRPSRSFWWLCSGLALGIATSARPLTGVALGASLVLWETLRRDTRARELPVMLGAMALGGLAPIMATLAYNAVTTGHPMRFGYDAANAGLTSLGFGVRGLITYFPDGIARPVASSFTPLIALKHVGNQLLEFSRGLLPGGLVLLLLVLSRRHWLQQRRLALAGCFLLLPIAQGFYYFSSIRFYAELIPFALLGCAFLVSEMSRSRPIATSGLVAIALCANLFSLLAAWTEATRIRADWEPYFRRVEDARRTLGRVVVFVKDTEAGEPLLTRLWWHNIEPARGIAVVRDLGDRNGELLLRLPGYRALFLVAGEAAEVATDRRP